MAIDSPMAIVSEIAIAIPLAIDSEIAVDSEMTTASDPRGSWRASLVDGMRCGQEVQEVLQCLPGGEARHVRRVVHRVAEGLHCRCHHVHQIHSLHDTSSQSAFGT